MVNQTLFAFWKNHDTFPYILGGEVIAIHDDGKVSIKGYQGFRFQPLTILPFEAGWKLREELEKLRQSYESEEKKLKKEFMEKAKKLAPFIK